MDDMITFKVDITYLILGINWKSLLSGFGKHVCKPSRMIVYPIISTIITYQFSLLIFKRRSAAISPVANL